MRIRNFRLSFSTPAFLGDAEQSGVWRTPPIKALLRQWWRVAYAAQWNFPLEVSAMRQEEASLFGYAGDEGASRSLVRLRLEKWTKGTQTEWQALQRVEHPEVKNSHTGMPKPIGSDLYLGFGPLLFQNGGTNLKANAAIQAGESARLSLAYPENHSELIEQALWLMDRFGTLGGRSRNGWGSFSLQPGSSGVLLTGTLPLREWTKCLDRDWPHAIGKDRKGALIWETALQADQKNDWKSVMVKLAETKIGLRTHFKFPNEVPPHHDALPRHWLSYPITKHATRAFPKDARLPNSLRFKVRPAENGQVVGVVFHVPCLPPADFCPNRAAIEDVWQKVHRFLDNGLPRSDS
jgi:CRISPR-associated protein Cmr1